MSSTSHSPTRPGTSTATEFVIEEFETEVPEERVQDLLETVETAVSRLRDEITSDDRLEELLRSGPGSDVLTENDSTEHGDPKPTTKHLLIGPLFDALGYPEMATEVGDLSEQYGLQAEIDAAAFHAYGLDREETNFVLDDFHRVQNPRIMTEEYFDLVAEKYDELEATT